MGLRETDGIGLNVNLPTTGPTTRVLKGTAQTQIRSFRIAEKFIWSCRDRDRERERGEERWSKNDARATD